MAITSPVAQDVGGSGGYGPRNRWNFGGQGRPQADDALWQQFMGADQAGKLALTSRATGSDQYNAIRRRAIAEGFVPDTNAFQAYFSQLGVPGFSGNPGDTPGAGTWGPQSNVKVGNTTFNGTQPTGAAPTGAVPAGGASTGQWGALGSSGSGNLGSPGYGVNVSDYLDPSMRFQMDEAQRVLENSAAARGSLNSGQTLRDLTSLATNMARTDYGNAFNRVANTRDFTYGVDSADRLFDYNANRADQAFDYNRLRDLAQMGLSGTNSSASGQNNLAGILAGLMGNAGQIQASGTIGGSNTINNTISQILQQMMGTSMLNSAGV